MERVRSIRSDDDLADIRPALKARLRQAAAHYDFHIKKANEFKAETDDLTRQLDREEARFASKEEGAPKEELPPLTAFILSQLKAATMDKETLRQRARERGYDVDGRSIHAALVNLKRQGKIEEIGDSGQFRLISGGSSLFRRV